jgi:membrane associated rhomboid family serine protease
MGIYDRDYYRETLPRGGFGHFIAMSVSTWLIVINVGVFFVDAALARAERPTTLPEVLDQLEHKPTDDAARAETMFFGMGPLQRAGYFSTDKAIRHGQIWRFITFQFLHANPIHLILNMVGIFLF